MQGMILSHNGFEDLELYYPYYRLGEEDIEFELTSPVRESIKGKHGYEIETERNIYHVNKDSYDFLIIPGGEAPSKLKNTKTVLKVVRHFFEEDKPVATICHGPEVLISAGVVEDRKLTS
ncbi:MAG: DJ-1/PfpI family protein, partial [Candidatus Aenigmatarchaeota archaeon]